MERLEQMAKRWQERRRQIEEKDRRKLKKRLTIFLVLYLPVAVAVLVMGISGRVSAGKDKEQDVDTIEDFIESSQSDSIYTYEAGKEVSGQVLEEMSIPTDFPMDVMLTLLRFGEVEEGGEAIAGYFGGMADMIMMRIVDILYTVPDVLIIILLAQVLGYPLQTLSKVPGFGWIGALGPNMVSMFIVFGLLYWVGMARIIRGQIMLLKQNEYVTAAHAMGATNGRIIRKHLLTNCIGTLIVTTTLQIPSSIFTESFLSFLGLGVQAPMPSLGSLASAALNGLQTYPEKLFAPAFMIFVIILSFNLLGDGLRDAFDPKMKS